MWAGGGRVDQAAGLGQREPKACGRVRAEVGGMSGGRGRQVSRGGGGWGRPRCDPRPSPRPQRPSPGARSCCWCCSPSSWSGGRVGAWGNREEVAHSLLPVPLTLAHGKCGRAQHSPASSSSLVSLGLREAQCGRAQHSPSCSRGGNHTGGGDHRGSGGGGGWRRGVAWSEGGGSKRGGPDAEARTRGGQCDGGAAKRVKPRARGGGCGRGTP